jgi:hypothetical protein
MTEAEWLACTDPEKMLAFLRGNTTERQLRLFAVACCRRVWDRLLNERSRWAVEVIERHVERQASDDQKQTAVAEAEQAYRAVKEQVLASFVGPELAHRASQMPRGLFDLTNRQTALEAHNAADGDPLVLAASAVWTATSLEADFVEAGYSLLDSAMNTANQTSDPAPNPQAEKTAQASMLQDIFANPFRPVTLDPAWLTWNGGLPVSMAQRMYDSRDFSDIPVLADALEEAGCSDPDILGHCREPGEHVRGCWVVDLLLGKS